MATYTYGTPIKPSLDELLDRALTNMNGDPVMASNLFLRWAESDSDIRALIPDVVTDYIRRRIKQRAKELAK